MCQETSFVAEETFKKNCLLIFTPRIKRHLNNHKFRNPVWMTNNVNVGKILDFSWSFFVGGTIFSEMTKLRPFFYWAPCYLGNEGFLKDMVRELF